MKISKIKSEFLRKELLKTFPLYILGMFFQSVVIYYVLIISQTIGKILDLLLMQNINSSEIMSEIYKLLFYNVLLVIPHILKRWCYLTNARTSDTRIRKVVFDHVQYSKEEYYEKIEKGKFMAYMTKEIYLIRKFLGNFFQAIVSLLVTPILSITISASSLNFNLSLILIIIVPISLVRIWMLFKKKIIKVEEARQEYLEISKIIEQNTSNFTLIKLYNNQYEQKKKFDKENEKMTKKDYEVGKVDAKIDNSINIFTAMTYILGVSYCIYLLTLGQITVGDLTVFTTFVNKIFSKFKGPIRDITDGVIYFKQAVNRIENLLALDTYEKNGKKEIEQIDNIKIKDLEYNYSGSSKKVLKNVNLEINKNEKIGIIGLFGSGKTTLMNIITGLYDVSDNKVFINGTDINKINKYSIFKNVSYILQRDLVVDDTIKNNITLDIEYDGKKIIKATKKACILEDIFKMDKEFDEKVGEKGEKLSGGQRQRLLLARNMITDRDFIIFDDVLSALDSRTEQEVLQNILNEKNKTMVIISNKVSNMEKLDRVYILVDGEIVDSGKHFELLDRNTLYKEMYDYEMVGDTVG